MMLALLRRSAIPGVPGVPERFHLIDGFRAADFGEIFEENRNRLDPVPVAVNDGMLQRIMYCYRSVFHEHSPYFASNYSHE
jgi:hypothetical protein